MLACTSQEAETNKAKATSRLRALVSLYNRHIIANGKPPADATAFEQFIAEKGGAMLEKLQVDTPKELLISERDGEPFVVVYDGSPPAGSSREVVAYEKQGIDGRRWVGFRIGAIEELDEPQFQELMDGSASGE